MDDRTLFEMNKLLASFGEFLFRRSVVVFMNLLIFCCILLGVGWLYLLLSKSFNFNLLVSIELQTARAIKTKNKNFFHFYL